MRLATICSTNQWTPDAFQGLVDHHERQEVRAAAAYDVTVDRAVIRGEVVRSLLEYVMPAGNA